jgi:hypothetical protein
MPNDFDTVASTPMTVMSTWLVPRRCETEPRTASDGMAQSWKPSCSASLAYACTA